LHTPHSDGTRDELSLPQWEYDARDDIFSITRQPASELRGKRVLDLGSGYGGRTAAYAELEAQVVGLEPVEAAIDGALRFAASRHVDAEFVRGFGEQLPFSPDSFDVVISFDVLEHVEDPEAVFAEISRVTRTGGAAWLVFPTYLGARSGHLDPATRIPGLQRIFAPDALAAAADDFATESFIPRTGPFGRRTVRETLNGMSRADALAIMSRQPFRWDVVSEPIIEPRSNLKYGPQVSAALSRLGNRLPELLVGRVIAVGRRL
jgi:SAM-dependent methyltransferase